MTTPEPPTPAIGLLLSDDLLFGSRITGTAEALGLLIRVARTVGELLRQAGELRPVCVLLDLHHPELVIADVVARLKALEAPPCIVGYGSHVDAATLHAARQAGCDRVLPRSRFVEELPRALPSWYGRSEDAS
jgi:CheY-like chemotaxis protein